VGYSATGEAVLLGTEGAAHGFDDIGALQTGGTINSAAAAGGRWSGKTILTMAAAHSLERGAPIVIAGTTSYNGPTRVLRVIDSTRVVVNKAFVATEAGTFTRMGGESAWAAFMPMGADLLAADITILTFFDDTHGNSQKVQTYAQDRVYYFPGIIKQIHLAAGNVRLFRHANLNPGGRNLT
jgi:hypothetical protein